MAVDPQIIEGIREAAAELGISPTDLATVISYETGGTFDPTKTGPTTKWGQHKGLIQFGEPQAMRYGVDWEDPIGSQLGADGAVVKYLRDRGFKKGMGLLELYATINAGSPGRIHASDHAAGGMPGSVLDKVNSQMGGHRAKAAALFPDDEQPDISRPAPTMAPTGIENDRSPSKKFPGFDLKTDLDEHLADARLLSEASPLPIPTGATATAPDSERRRANNLAAKSYRERDEQAQKNASPGLPEPASSSLSQVMLAASPLVWSRGRPRARRGGRSVR